MSTIDLILIIVTLATAVWWALAHRRRPKALAALSVAALALAAGTLALEGAVWQLVPWQLLAVAATGAAALRQRRPGRSRRRHRLTGRILLVVGLALGGIALLTAFVPTMPTPSGPHGVGSEIFRWTDERRPETFTADPSDRRQVVAQAWYPTDVAEGPAVPYFEAQGRLPGSISGLPSFVFTSFGSVETHAVGGAPVSRTQRKWPVLVFSPGLSIAREQYAALCADLASRGFVVVALSSTYESSVTVLEGGRVVGQLTYPDVMGPAPHVELERLIDVRSADAGFVVDRLGRLERLHPRSPLAGRLDLRHLGIIGHSIGGATAAQVMAADPRFKVGVNIDGKLFRPQRSARLDRPFLWIQSDGAQTTEYTQGRDRFLRGLRDKGALLTIRKSAHMSFTDDPSYLTPLGRRLIGAALGVGEKSLADMTSTTGDAVSAFVSPALGIESGPGLDDVLAAQPAIRSESRGGSTSAVPDPS